jgi:hypothetical protein
MRLQKPEIFSCITVGGATGRVYTAEELRRKFIHYLFPRTTNTQGCVTLHS